MMTLRFALLMCALTLSGGSLANDDGPWTLKLGSWVCSSPELHDQVVAEERKGEKSPFALQKEYQDQCLYMDDDNLEDMMAPYVSVLGEDGEMTKVAFFIEFYKRIEFLHRQITHVRFVGWTASENVKPLHG